MSVDRSDVPPLVDLNAQLERALIDEYLTAHGCDPRHLDEIPDHLLKDLLREACLHASAKLAEVESRAHYVHEIHGH